MATSVFMKADEVQELLGVSRSEAYRIMKKLNDDLKEKGFIVLSGRVSRKYLEEMIYGYPSIKSLHWVIGGPFLLGSRHISQNDIVGDVWIFIL